MALSEQQVANLYARLTQIRVQITDAQGQLDQAMAGGLTHAEARNYRARVTRLKRERGEIGQQLADNAANPDPQPRPAAPPKPTEYVPSRPRRRGIPKAGSTVAFSDTLAAVRNATEAVKNAQTGADGLTAQLDEALQFISAAAEGLGGGELPEAQGAVAGVKSTYEDSKGRLAEVAAALDNLAAGLARFGS